MSRRTGITLLIIVIVIGLLAWFKIKNKPKEQMGQGPMPGGKPPVARVSGYVVYPQELANNIRSSGTVLANQEVEIRSEIGGKIRSIFFKEGSHVLKGQLLVKIHDEDLQAQLAKLRANLKVAVDREAREKKLLAKGGVSQEEYDVTESQLTGVRADIGLLEAQIAKTELRAPFNGVIGLKSVSEGSYISPSVVIATLQETDPLKLDFSIPEKYMSQVKVGDKIVFTVSESDEKNYGTVYAIEPKVDAGTRSVLLRALCPNTQGKILPGAFAQVEVIMQEIHSAILIPTQALIPELKGYKVYISKNGKALPRPVKTGIRTDVNVQITEGLNAGDTVITTGIMSLKPDAPVKVTAVPDTTRKM